MQSISLFVTRDHDAIITLSILALAVHHNTKRSSRRLVLSWAEALHSKTALALLAARPLQRNTAWKDVVALSMRNEFEWYKGPHLVLVKRQRQRIYVASSGYLLARKRKS
jgi:hypothetical protein